MRPGRTEANGRSAHRLVLTPHAGEGGLNLFLEAADQFAIGGHQIIQRFATEADLERRNASGELDAWHERLRPVADGDPEYRLLNGLDAWFTPTALPAHKPLPLLPRWMGWWLRRWA